MKRPIVLLAVLATLAIGAAAQEAGDQMSITDPTQLKYENFPGVPTCSTGAVLRGDPRTGPARLLIRGAAGCEIPMHWHSANEELYMVSGRMELRTGQGSHRLRPGSWFYMPAKHRHAVVCPTACSYFIAIDAVFDINYVDEQGNALTVEQALARANKKGKGKAKP